MKMPDSKEQPKLKPYLSVYGAWALALGTSVGWGSMVITGNTYLAQAGPAGSIIGLLIGAAIMLVISRSYTYMMKCYPDAGGAYTYVKEVFSPDYGFVAAWFLLLAYMAVFWANATSLPLFARYFIGDMFKFGIRYSVLGYEMYLGEALLSILFIILFAYICTLDKKTIGRVMVFLSATIMIGITLSTSAGALCYDNDSFTFLPSFIPEGRPWFLQAIYIACISPWAFIGFENISHSAEEFTFSKDKIYRILSLSVISATLVYIFVIVLSVTAYPPEYANWLEYINDLGNLQGIKALPAFYAVHHYWGNVGLGLLMGSLMALILTSLIGNLVALSRLLFSLARDGVIPERFGALNKHNAPANAIYLAAGVSLIIPFLGRTAIGWIVDVTILSATLIYAMVSASTAGMARRRGDHKDLVYGVTGVVLMTFFAGFVLIPNLFSVGSMATETYILFTVWSVLGFIVFHRILKTDHQHKFGKSIVVWIVLLAMILFASLVWLNQTTLIATINVIQEVQNHYDQTNMSNFATILEASLNDLWRGIISHMTVVVILFAVSLFMMLNNYRIMSRRANESEEMLGNIRNTAYRDPLTGVKSKLAYTEKVNEINAAIESGEMEIFSTIVLDVNGLKIINDTLGHKAGDEYIRKACMIICKIFQHSPVYRVGGDEFVVILTGEDFEHRYELMNELNRIVEENAANKEAVVAAGISDYVSGKDSSLREIFERADELMYKRKKELKEISAGVAG